MSTVWLDERAVRSWEIPKTQMDNQFGRSRCPNGTLYWIGVPREKYLQENRADPVCVLSAFPQSRTVLTLLLLPSWRLEQVMTEARCHIRGSASFQRGEDSCTVHSFRVVLGHDDGSSALQQQFPTVQPTR